MNPNKGLLDASDLLNASVMESRSTRRKPPPFLAVLNMAMATLEVSNTRPEAPEHAPRMPSLGEVERIRQERIQRKLLNARRRLPKGHPDRI
jgi:hypothetical protein